MGDVVVGIRLTADGDGLVGELKISQKELDKLGREALEAGKKARAGAKGVDKFGREAAQAERKAKRLARSNAELGRSFTVLRGVFAAAGLFLLIRQNNQLSDTYQLLRARLSLTAEAERDLAGTEADLFRRAQETRTAYGAMVRTFFRTSRALKDYKDLAGEAANFTELLAKSVRVSGATTIEAAAGMLQLSQGLASGQLRGEEFRSVTENISDVALRLAAALRVTIGELREMANQGELTTDIVVGALLSQADAIERDFEKLPRTIGEAMVQFRNELLLTVGQMNEAEGASASYIEGIDALRDSIKDAVPVIAELVGGIAQLAALTGENLDTVVALTGAYITYRLVAASLAALHVAGLIPSLRLTRDLWFAITALMRAQMVPAAVLALEALARLRVGFLALTAAMIANPLIPLAIAAGLLAGGYLLLRDSTDEVAEAQARYNENLGKIQKLIGEAATASRDRQVEIAGELLGIRELNLAEALLERDRVARKAAQIAAAREQFEGSTEHGTFGLLDEQSDNRPRSKAEADLEEIDARILKTRLEIARARGDLAALRSAVETEIKNSLEGILTGKALEKLKEQFADLEEALDPLLKRQRDLAAATDLVQSAFANSLITDAQKIQLLGQLARKYPDAATAAKNFVAAITKANQDEIKLAKLSERDRKIEIESRRQLAAARKANIELTPDQIEAIRAEIAARVDAIDVIDKETEAREKLEQERDRIAEVAKENIQEAIADGIFDALDGSLKSVEDYFDEFSRIGKRAIAETLAQFVTTKFPDLAKQLGLISLGTGFAGSIFGGGIGTSVGGGLGGAGGGALGEAIGGERGKDIGAAIGAFIGGAIGSLFNGDSSLQLQTALLGSVLKFEDRQSRQTPFGILGFTTGSEIPKETTAGLVEQLARIDETIASVLTSSQVAAAAAALLAQQGGGGATGPGRGTRIEFTKKDFGEQLFNAVKERLETILDAALDQPGIAAKAFAGIKPGQENLDALIKTATDIVEIPKLITEQLAAIRNPMQFELDQLDRIFQDRVELFKKFGVDIADLEELHAAERKAIIEKFSTQASSALEDMLISLTSGPGSAFAPQVVLSNAEARFDELFASALAGDASALAAFPAAAENLLAAAEANFATTQPFFEANEKVIDGLEQLIGLQSEPPDLAPLLVDINQDIIDGNREINDNLESIDGRMGDLVELFGGGLGLDDRAKFIGGVP